MTQAVKRACDACHRRKVKCDGINPCRNCSSAQLSCTYNAIPQKKGPKGSRAKVISELRETQRQTSLSAKVQNRMNGIASPPGSPNMTPTPGLLTSEMVKECVEFYFTHVYEKIPILDRRQLEHQMLYMEQNRDTYCLLTSLCAFIMLQPGMSMPAGDPYNLDVMPGANIISSNLLLEETLRVRKGYEFLEQPSLNTLATSYFLLGCYHGLELHDKSWFYLREATTMMYMNGMTKEETYLQWDNVEASRRRRLYWLFFVTERAHALQRHRPLTLQATINPPTLTDDPTDPLAHQLNGFVLQVNLFRPFDDALTGVWTKMRGNLSTPYVSSLQKQLNEVIPSYLCQDGQLTDLRTNQQWLKTTIWQLTNGGLNSHAEDGMNFQYPMDLSRELLVNLASQFPGQSMDFLNSGLIEKMFEVACSMTDVLHMQPASRDPFTTGPREHLNQILNMVSVLRHGDHRFLPLLLSKVSDVLPRLANPMLQSAPENCNLASIDIFDGFGNAGMAQPPPQMQMQLDTEYDRKFSVSEYDKKFSVAEYDKKYSMSDMNANHTDSASVTGSTGATSVPPVSAADINSPFVSSPSIMSPPMEFPHISDYSSCTPMSDMVISPMCPPSSAGPMSNQHPQHQPHHILQSQCLSTQQMQPGIGQRHGHNHNGMQPAPSIGGISPQALPSQAGMNSTPMPTSHPMGQGMSSNGNAMMNTMARQPPQRANSFAMPQQPQLPRTVGDFHALQRANSDTMSGMTGMGSTEMDFNTLR